MYNKSILMGTAHGCSQQIKNMSIQEEYKI